MNDPQYELKRWLGEKVEPRGVSTHLAKALRVNATAISRMKNLDSDNPKERRKIGPEEIAAIARFFNELPPGYEAMTTWLSDQPDAKPSAKSNASFPPQYQRFAANQTTPLLGQTKAGPNGRFILNGSEIGRVFTPPMLEGVEDAYAVRVYGSSMEPRFFAGETVWLNPSEPVRQNDDVVVQLITDEENGRESYIKRYVSQSSLVTRLYQYNPDDGEEKDLEFPTTRVFSVHKIVFHAAT
jgi:phage repressor protein C with HTH and peptisase S24 domain